MNETGEAAADRLLDYAVNGPRIAGTHRRAEPAGDPVKYLLHQAAYCDWWGDSKSQEFLDAFASRLAQHIATLLHRGLPTVTGRVSGDCECFCWEVTEEEYRRIKSRRAYWLEKTIREEDPNLYGGAPWRIYPGDLIKGNGVKTYTIVEEPLA